MHKRFWLGHFPRHRASPILFPLVLLTLLSGCGTSQGAAPTRIAAKPTPLPTATPVIVTQQVSFVTSDGVTLLGTLYGQGTRAIILSNEGDNLWPDSLLSWAIWSSAIPIAPRWIRRMASHHRGLGICAPPSPSYTPTMLLGLLS